MPCQHCSNSPDIAQEIFWANIEQKYKIVWMWKNSKNMWHMMPVNHKTTLSKINISPQ